MARSRFIKPEFFDDPILAKCSPRSRLLFASTWQLADRLGVFAWDEAKLRKYAFGYEDVTISDVLAMLDELLKHGFIKYGVFKGKKYGFVVNLAKHQKFHPNEKSIYDDVLAGAIWTASIVEDTIGTAEDHLGDPRQVARHLPAGLYSLYSPSLETRTETLTPLEIQSTKKKRKPRISLGASPAKAIGVTIPLREAWKAAYLSKYGKEAAWGAREGGQATTLLGSYTSDDVVALVPFYFAWNRPEVIKGGHSFCRGSACFVLKIDELRADIADADRRKTAAKIQQHERDADRNTQQQDQAARVVAKILGGSAHVGQQTIDFTQTIGDTRPDEQDYASMRDVHPPAVGSGDGDMD